MAESDVAAPTSDLPAQAAATVGDTAVVAPAQAASPAAPDVPLLGGDPPSADAASPEGVKPEADAKPGDLPETYVVSLPEGETVDAPRLDAYQAALKDAALTQAQADKLTPFLLGQIRALQEQQLSAWADTTKAWRESVVNDAEIGGAKLRDSLVAAARARDQYGSPDFKALLADPNLGIGNHPAVVKFLASVGKSMGEDVRTPERQQGNGVDTRDKSAAAVGARMFPKMVV